MARREAILRSAIGCVFLIAATAATAVTSAGTDRPDAGNTHVAKAPAASSVWDKPAAQAVVAPAAPERALSANPLWAIPLSALSGTRDRPIFSPSRRPPAPTVAPFPPPKIVVAPKPREPDLPPLALVGTVSSRDEGFGLFLERSTKAALRLKIGEDYQGWKLRSVQGREVTLAKDQELIILALPSPGTGQPTGDAPGARPLSATPLAERPER
jgi:hypothetical protein